LASFSWANLRLACLRLAFPQTCLECGKIIEQESCFCPACQAEIGFLPPAPNLCPRCGAPDCTHQPGSTGLLQGVWALAWHEGPLARALAKFKYEGSFSHGQALGRYMAKNMSRPWQGQFDLMAPVPLHPRRLRRRGFNQAMVLASYLAPEKLRADLLLRRLDTRPQVGLSGPERLDNLKGSFALNPKYQVKGLKVLLIDDVWTTGSTLRECARTLKAAQASRVGAVTLTRTAPQAG
jgi:ComF family protein